MYSCIADYTNFSTELKKQIDKNMFADIDLFYISIFYLKKSRFHSRRQPSRKSCYS